MSEDYDRLADEVHAEYLYDLEIDRLTAENARLRAALEALVVAYEKRGAYGPDKNSRAARAVLEESAS